MHTPASVRNRVIRASAGTGKTFQLSNRFLELVAEGEPVDSLLATTFTRKAAGEILDRVVSRLAEAALDRTLAAELGGFIGHPGLPPARCREMLVALLRHLHRLRVETLDSFFIQVAGSFAIELELPPGWRIVDEAEDAAMRAQAIQELLRSERTDYAVELMHLLTKGTAARSVGEQIGGLVKGLYSYYLEAPAENAWSGPPRRKLLDEAELAAAVAAFEQFPKPKQGLLAKAHEKSIERVRAADWDGFVAVGIAAKLAAGEDAYSRVRIPAEMAAVYRPLVEYARALVVARIANQTEATYRLLARFDRCYQAIKQRRRAYRFEDVTGRLAGTAWDGRLDEIAFRLDAGVAHLLLDEFQDTSSQQWRALRPFARRAAGCLPAAGAGGPDSLAPRTSADAERPRSAARGSFFCVGDVKQAIYGWRGGVAEIFDALDDELGRLEHDSLDRSFRSSQPVIDTVNRVFTNLPDNPAISNYADAASAWVRRFTPHETAKADLPGYCRLLAAPKAPEGGDQGTATLAFAADYIRDRYAAIAGRSVGVLVRKNQAVARLIYELRRRNVPASEEGGNPLIDSPKVQLVVSLLRLIDHPGDTAARYHLVRSPLAEHLPLADYGSDKAAAELSLRLRGRLMAEGYGRFLLTVVQWLAPHCDARELRRLMQLVEQGYAFEAQAGTRCDAFRERVETQRVLDPTAADVRVMTVHQAKGLQFDVVVLPELDPRLIAQTPQLVVGRPSPVAPLAQVCRYAGKADRPLLPKSFQKMFEAHSRSVVEEALCLLYVALTRAVHALVMIVAPSGDRERNLPATFAGLLRGALADPGRAEPETTLYEHGDRYWFRQLPRRAEAAAPSPEPLRVALASGDGGPAARGRERRSPSQLEGGNSVNLRLMLQADAAAALEHGTLIHAWCEAIEWLDDGPPPEPTLRAIAARQNLGHRVSAETLSAFRTMLNRPSVREVFTRAVYAGPQDHGPASLAAAGAVDHPRWEVFRELPFAIHDDDSLLTGSIDRLVVLFDGSRPLGAEVIDFKTDRIAPGDEAALAARVEHYRPQLAAYRRAVARTRGLPEDRISARLVFLHLARVVPL